MEAPARIKLTIDGREVEATEGSTILDVAQANGIRIPTLCHHPGLSSHGGCRLCVVEIDGAPRLAASCVTPIRKGMAVVTVNDRIIEARRTILEYLFSERSHFCMFCASSGDCELQALAYEYQLDHVDAPSLEGLFPTDASHPDLVIDHNRCILCGRCVRACHEVAGAGVLDFHNRGGRTMIGADLTGPLGQSTCLSCGVCEQVCPTGAIHNRHQTHYAVHGKDKDWQTIESFCPSCGLHCRTVNYVRNNHLLRVEGLLNDSGVDRGQLCRLGRFEPLMSPAVRLDKPLLKNESGQWVELEWPEALSAAGKSLAGLRRKEGQGAVAGYVSSALPEDELAGFKELVLDKLKAGRLDCLDGDIGRKIALALKQAGSRFKEAPLSAVAESDLIVLVGADLESTHPMVCGQVRRALMESKAKLAVIGPVNNFGTWAAVHLPVEGTDMGRALKAITADSASMKDFWSAWEGKGLTQLTETFYASRRPILIAGLELTLSGGVDGLSEAIRLAEARRQAKASYSPLIILKPSGNSEAAWRIGLAGETAAPESKIRGALVCLDGEVEIGDTIPREAEFVAVLTPYFSQQVADRAHLLLPRPTALESRGTYTGLDGSTRMEKQPVLKAPRQVRPLLETLNALADALQGESAGRGKN